MPRVFINTAFHGVRFKCQRCGTCCHHKRPAEFGDLVPMEQLKEFWEKSNLIYLTAADIENIRRERSLDPSDFVDTLYRYDGKSVHVDDSGKRIILDFPVMKSKKDTTCVFYDNGCTIYSLRPKACQLFPFRVDEKTNAQGDITLALSYNQSCPGIGNGKIADKKELERLVYEQFQQRSESVAAEVRILAQEGKISQDAMIFRSHPGRRAKSKPTP